jgi:hypothetical protein
MKTQEEIENEKEEEAEELRERGYSEEEIEMIQKGEAGSSDEGRIGSTEEELLYTQSDEQYDPELRQVMH